MSTSCKNCGCSCKLCNTSSLDFHHDIEMLQASLAESRSTNNSLKSELKRCQEERDTALSRQSDECVKLNDKYDSLKSSHRHLELVNHDLEDKILELIQQSEKEQQETMSIHEQLHKDVKHLNSLNQRLLDDKNRLAKQCQVVLDLLNSTGGSSMPPNFLASTKSPLMSKELFKLTRILNQESDLPQTNNPEPTRSAITEPTNFLPVSTFPPCAIMFEHNSPKVVRRQVQSSSSSSMPRNASDTQLLTSSQKYPTSHSLCSKCKTVVWTRDEGTQTEAAILASYKQPRSRKPNNVIYDI